MQHKRRNEKAWWYVRETAVTGDVQNGYELGYDKIPGHREKMWGW